MAREDFRSKGMPVGLLRIRSEYADEDEHESILALHEPDGDVVAGVGPNATGSLAVVIGGHDMHIASANVWLTFGGTRHVPKVVQDEHFRTSGVVLVEEGGGAASH